MNAALMVVPAKTPLRFGLLAAAIWLAATVGAFAQTFPTVADHSVVGRIGVGGSSGPAQSIPWATLLANIAGTPAANTVWAGPASGGAGQPSFRHEVTADLPQGIANSIFINPTGSTANMQNVAVPACANDGAHALVYVNGTGLQCASLTATLGIVSVKKQVFTSSGTYTPSTGMLYAIIECVGPGGGGGSNTGTTSNATISAGGGGGAYSRVTVTAAAVGASKTVTIGTGGAGGTAAGAGSNGSGATSVGSLCTAPAGSGAAGGANGVNGGAGGVAGTGDFSVPGAGGDSGAQAPSGTTNLGTGRGGGSGLGFGAGGRATTTGSGTSATGAAGSLSGGGGAGGIVVNLAATAAGGAGANGIVYIQEFNNQ
jgi:hypothetical protein